MTNRVSHIMVTLTEPLMLNGLEAPVPIGCYEVTTEEEPLGDFMYEAYRRVSATIYLPQPPGRVGIGQVIDVDAEELAGLLECATPIRK